MMLRPQTLTAKENSLFDALARKGEFRGRLYRDGVPSPEIYLAQRVRALFAFREPNMGGTPYALDMRDEVRDEQFRPLGCDGTRLDRSLKCWWNAKAGLFAHAAAAALEGEPAKKAFRRFSQGGWNHEVVNRFGYVQIKKIGGAGTSNPAELRAHAMKYADILQQQVQLYRPHLVLGCGVGGGSPAQLMAAHVLPDGQERRTEKSGATWWEFSAASRPRALVQLWHPARRGDRWTLYKDVWVSVREVAREAGLGQA